MVCKSKIKRSKDWSVFYIFLGTQKLGNRYELVKKYPEIASIINNRFWIIQSNNTLGVMGCNKLLWYYQQVNLQLDIVDQGLAFQKENT